MLKIGILMDDIAAIKPYKDTTFLMMLAALSRGHKLYYFNQNDLIVKSGKPLVKARAITVKDNTADYYSLKDTNIMDASNFNVILMRKDPPFDMEYIYSTYWLELAEEHGVFVANPANALRTVNEKFFASRFDTLTPKTLVTANQEAILDFIHDTKHVVIKPLDGMGGEGIFKSSSDDPNLNGILSTVSASFTQSIMIQAYLPNVYAGDKRIIIINGEAVPYGLARIPQGTDFRANLAAGGRGEVQAITEKEQLICDTLKPVFQKLGLVFVGIDVIGGYLTEINVTSPTCLREIENETKVPYAEKFIQVLEAKSNN